MRALTIDAWGAEPQLGERAEPAPGPGEVLVEVEACGIGLTVLNCIRGDLGADPANLPRVPGHEIIGMIRTCGPGVDPGRVGERIAAYFYLFCGDCDRCAAGLEPLCRNHAGYLGVDRDGGYAELVALPARNALTINARIEAAAATTIPDAIATPVHVSRRAQIGAGDRVAVIAAGGGLGIHMIQVARRLGANVIALEAAAEKLDHLERELGFQALDSSDFSRLRLPAGWDGADVIVDFLGSEASLSWAQSALAPRGRLVVLTTFPGVVFPASPRELVLGERAVIGSRYASRDEVREAAELVAAGDVEPVIGARTGPEGVSEVHEALRAGTLLGRGALVWR